MTRYIRASLALIALSSSIFASSASAYTNEYDGNWFLTFGGGRSFYRMDGDSYIPVCPGCPPDHYYKTDIHDGSFLNLIGGYAFTRYNTAFPAAFIGVNLTYAFNGKVSGYINQFDLTEFKNYVYSYEFSRQSIMPMVKIDLFNGRGFMPFVMAAGGVSFNRASSYREQPLGGVTPRVSPGYSTRTRASCAFMLGAGFDYALRDDIYMSLSYQYGDFGTVETGDGRDNESITGLNYGDDHVSNKLRANSVILDFTYLINYV